MNMGWDGLLGVRFAFASIVARAFREGLEAVDDKSSNRLRMWPSFCGVGPRCIRIAAGVGSSSTSSSFAGTPGIKNCELGFCGVAVGAAAFLGVAWSVFVGLACCDSDCFADGLRSLSYSLYCAAVTSHQHQHIPSRSRARIPISTLFLMSSRLGLFPPCCIENCFSHVFNSARRVAIRSSDIPRHVMCCKSHSCNKGEAQRISGVSRLGRACFVIWRRLG